ncbi:MAG: hypothetical protein KGL90_14655 [Burkholderiales bacterium]|nr:hypothetical protein [Burkholderiales bacterium]
MTLTRNLISALALSLIAAGAMAQSKADDHQAHHPEQAASAAPGKAAPADKPASGMHGHMSKHYKEMQRIMAIKDPAKRLKAMDAHMKAMQDGDCDMMKDGMMGDS